jgi:hypothetical protein
MLPEGIEKRLSKHIRGEKQPRKNKEERRTVDGKQTTYKWIDSQ